MSQERERSEKIGKDREDREMGRSIGIESGRMMMWDTNDCHSSRKMGHWWGSWEILWVDKAARMLLRQRCVTSEDSPRKMEEIWDISVGTHFRQCFKGWWFGIDPFVNHQPWFWGAKIMEISGSWLADGYNYSVWIQRIDRLLQGCCIGIFGEFEQCQRFRASTAAYVGWTQDDWSLCVQTGHDMAMDKDWQLTKVVGPLKDPILEL